MGFRDLLVFPFRDGLRQQARLFLGGGNVVMFFLELHQGFMTGVGLRGGVGMGHGRGTFDCLSEAFPGRFATEPFVATTECCGAAIESISIAARLCKHRPWRLYPFGVSTIQEKPRRLFGGRGGSKRGQTA